MYIGVKIDTTEAEAAASANVAAGKLVGVARISAYNNGQSSEISANLCNCPIKPNLVRHFLYIINGKVIEFLDDFHKHCRMRLHSG